MLPACDVMVMANVMVHREDVELDAPTLIEGLPGAGLVGKIATDHLVSTFDMVHYASVHCDGLPPVAVYAGEDSEMRAPVRFYADPERNLLCLQSDVPVSASSAEGFAACITGWLAEHDVFPLYLSGLPVETDDVPEVFGVTTGGATDRLDEAGIVPPREGGFVSGPTGALLNEALERSFPSVGLIVQTEAQFPDPEAARALLRNGIQPLLDIDIPTDELVEEAEQIREAKERLANQIQQVEDDESTEAQPIRGFQ